MDQGESSRKGKKVKPNMDGSERKREKGREEEGEAKGERERENKALEKKRWPFHDS